MFDDLWICNNCDLTFEDRCGGCKEDYVGECHGTSEFETVFCCPHCGSTDLDEAAHCDLCDRVVPMDDLKGGACPACWGKIKKHYEHSAEKMTDLFKSEETEVKLNPFLVWALYGDKNVIEGVLLDFLKSKERDVARFNGHSTSYIDFLEDDEEATVQLVAERGDIDE